MATAARALFSAEASSQYGLAGYARAGSAEQAYLLLKMVRHGKASYLHILATCSSHRSSKMTVYLDSDVSGQVPKMLLQLLCGNPCLTFDFFTKVLDRPPIEGRENQGLLFPCIVN